MLLPIQFMTHLHPRAEAGASDDQVEEFDVVVVGAGPAGLASAITLGSYGVETLVIDKRPSASTIPRATVVSTGSAELLRRWGLENAVRAASLDVEWRAWAAPTLAAADEGEAIDVGYPTREQAAAISPVEPLCIGQDELEPVMEAAVKASDSARLERELELVELEREGGGGYLLTLVDAGGRRRTISARYVIGADGIRSGVREHLGIAVHGDEKLERRVGAWFRAPLWEVAGKYRYGIYFLDGGRSLIPSGKPDRWGIGLEGTVSADDDALPSTELVTQWIRETAGVPDLPVEVDRVAHVTFGVALAKRFRDGDAFLIGDAAHRVTPRGGTGMNSAIRDGFDLAWKLAWVLRGWAGDDLLDTYEAERRPVAEFNTDRSTRSDGSILPSGAGIKADIGGRIPHVWVPRGDGLVSTLDLLGEGLTLFAGPDWDGEVGPAGEPVPTRVERLDAISARGLGLLPDGHLVVRPDGMSLAASYTF